jgi:hypothetical protein
MRAGRRMVSFVTDLEGDLAYFERFVKRSDVLRFESEGKLGFRKPGAVFVHGGDLFDRGAGDIRLSHMLCDFKARERFRVFFLR